MIRASVAPVPKAKFLKRSIKKDPDEPEEDKPPAKKPIPPPGPPPNTWCCKKCNSTKMRLIFEYQELGDADPNEYVGNLTCAR